MHVCIFVYVCMQWRCFNRWVEYVESIRKARKAMGFWSNGLLSRCVMRWAEHVTEAREDNERQRDGAKRAAMLHWTHGVLWRVFSRWQAHTVERVSLREKARRGLARCERLAVALLQPLAR